MVFLSPVAGTVTIEVHDPLFDDNSRRWTISAGGAGAAESMAAAGQSGANYRSPLNVTLLESDNEKILLDAGAGTRTGPGPGSDRCPHLAPEDDQTHCGEEVQPHDLRGHPGNLQEWISDRRPGRRAAPHPAPRR